MPLKITLLGKTEGPFSFVQKSLRGGDFSFEFISLENPATYFAQLLESNLVILDTVPLSESEFTSFYFLRESSQFAHLPILALVQEQPARLKYRLIDMGINDYLTVPFDALDLKTRVNNIVKSSPLKLLSSNGTPPATQPSVVVLQSLTHIYQNMNRAIVDQNRSGLLQQVLRSLNGLCRCKQALLFDVESKNKLSLRTIYPDESLPETEFALKIENEPILVKAVRLKEPTILNRISSSNRLVAALRPLVTTNISSIFVYPVVSEKRTRSVLCLLKNDGESFSDLHYMLVENLVYFIAQSYYLDSLRSDIQDKMDNRVWKFYYDFLSQVVNQLDFGILIVGPEQRIKYLNKCAAELLQVAEHKVLYQPLSNILDEQTISSILDTADGTTPLSIERPELELEAADGKKHLIGFSVTPFTDSVNNECGFLLTMKDITYTKEIQEEMRRVDRLASLGVMASGIAHEIRNPLAGIKAMAQTFEEELTPDDPKGEFVQRIIRLVNRLDDLLRTLFSYAKPPKPDRRSCNMEDVLSDVMSLLRQKIRDQNIELERTVHPDLPAVYVDPGQIQQVMVNLLLNSIEAISQDGRIAISIESLEVEENAREESRPNYLALVKPGRYIRIYIHDNGCGIPAENLKHIFNPFFTTKTFGTGLGLSIVYQIVKENDGTIHFDSELDSGTGCHLFLPINEPAVVEQRASHP